MMRELLPGDREALKELIHETVESLKDKDFLIPLSEREQEELFSLGNRDMAYGVFENNKLVAATGLFFELSDFMQEEELKEIEWNRAAELGGNMTLPLCRGKGYMRKLCQQVVQSAYEQNLSYLLATAHPDNSAGIACLATIGMKWIKEYDRHGYRRNIYLLAL